LWQITASQGVLTLQSQSAVQDKASFLDMLRFFAPLAVTSVLMMSSHSLGSKAMVSTEDPSLALAGMSVAQSLALLMEGSVTIARQVGVALVKNRQTWAALVRMFKIVVVVLLLVMATIAFSPLGLIVFEKVLGAPKDVAEHAVFVFRFYMFFPTVSCLRMLNQSLIVLYRQTVFTTVAMACRISVMLGVTSFLVSRPTTLGGAAGAIVIVSGITTEAIVSWLAARRLVPKLDDLDPEGGTPVLQLAQAFRFYIPLAFSGVVNSLTRLALAAALSRTTHPTISLAAYQVSWTLSWAMISPLMAIHQVTAVFARTPESAARVRKFVFYVSLGSCALVLGFVLTGAASHVLSNWIGVSEELLTPALWSIALMAPVPLMHAWSEMFTGALLMSQDSLSISTGRMCYVLAASASALLGARFFPGLGACLAPMGMVMGSMCEVVFLYHRASKRLEPKFHNLFPLKRSSSGTYGITQ